MRWEDLFADLEAQTQALAARDRSAEVDELLRAEVSRLDLVSRLVPAVGTLVDVRGLGGLRATGAVRRVGPDWILLDEGRGREAVLRLGAVLSVSGLGRQSAPPPAAASIESRLGVGSVLRGIARDRSPVRVHLIDGTVLDGTIDRAGADFLELAVHDAGEVRRRGEVRDVLVLTHHAVGAVRRTSPA